MKPKENRTERLLRVAATLMRSEGISPRALMANTGVGATAAKEDLTLLRRIFSLRLVGKGRTQEWILDESLRAPRSLLDAISLTVGRQVASFLDGTELFGGIDRAGRDNSRFMGRNRGEHLDRKFFCQHEPARTYEDHRDVLNDCLTGLVYGKELAIEYEGISAHRSYAALKR